MTTQTEIEHTPGPWSFSKCTCGHPACRQFVLSNQGSVGFVEEDARLMCASPDMLAAASRVMDYATLDRIIADRSRHDNEVFGIRIGDLRALATAIAKAKSR